MTSTAQRFFLRQSGVVLFIALIALVVMSLAAVALIRSVDTNSTIAANLAFKQSATISADSGLESAITWLSENSVSLVTSAAASGYYSVCDSFDAAGDAPCVAANLTTTTWVPGTNSRYATGTDISAAGVDFSGNTIQYIIQRMCTKAVLPSGLSDERYCLYGAAPSQPGSRAVVDATGAGAPNVSIASPAYRITAKVTGPKNTVSYIQAFVY